MSTNLEQAVKCPCGEEFSTRLWSAVNVQTDPLLKERIMDAQLNVVKCPECGQFIYAERFVLYHDPEAELLGFIYPKDYEDERDRWTAKTQENFREAQAVLENKGQLPYTPVSFFGMDELVERLREEQEWRDQGDIVEYTAQRISIGVVRLRPNAARRRGLPTRLPVLRDKAVPWENRLQGGLKAILVNNDRLFLYREFLEGLSKNSYDFSGLERDMDSSPSRLTGESDA